MSLCSFFPLPRPVRSEFNVVKFHNKLNSSASFDFNRYFYSNDLSLRVKKTWRNRTIIAIRNLFSDTFRLSVLKDNFDKYKNMSAGVSLATKTVNFQDNFDVVEAYANTGTWPTDLNVNDEDVGSS